MLFILTPLVIGTSVVALTLWLLLTNYPKLFKDGFGKKPQPQITELPIITATGQIVNSVEDLDMHLEFLKAQLEEKEKELDTSKCKVASTEDNLKRLTDTANEVKKYYLKLKGEISRTDCECKDLKGQIEDYKLRQGRLREEVNENVKYYTDMLSNIDTGTQSGPEDYEVVRRLPDRNSSHAFMEKYGII